MEKGSSMKVIVAGGRDFGDQKRFDFEMNRIWKNECFSGPCLEIVSGGATGADSMGEEWAKKNGCPVKLFPADWNTHGTAAGPIRNKQMAEYADGLIAFWDRKSKGTKNMIDTAISHGLPVVVIEYE
jgi:hypothetical protein